MIGKMIVALGLTLAFAAGCAPRSENPSALAEAFLATALGGEHGPQHEIWKWDGPLQWRTSGATAADRAAIRETAALLGEATGLEIGPAGSASANVVFAFADGPARLDALADLAHADPHIARGGVAMGWASDGQPACFSAARRAEDGPRLVFAWIFIDAAAPPERRAACAAEEFAQSLGLSSDAPQPRPSMFDDQTDVRRLTGHDLALLRLLYDSRIRAGAGRAEVEAIVQTIIRGDP